jgi:short-subunit dehydrogenase
MDLAGKTYWLIGASEGMGRDLAKQLSQEGAHVMLSARNAERLKALSQELPNTRYVAVDVTDADAIASAFKGMSEIDGVIYNAGVYEPMRATSWKNDLALQMVDVNFTGAMRVLGAVMPDFVERGAGDITLIGSLAGYHGLPASIGYGASKAALISLAETMRHDLKDTGVIIRIVNPGFIKTRLTQKNDFKMPMLMESQDAAASVVKAMKSRRFRTDFPAPFSWVIRVIDYLPDFLTFRGK